MFFYFLSPLNQLYQNLRGFSAFIHIMSKNDEFEDLTEKVSLKIINPK